MRPKENSVLTEVQGARDAQAARFGYDVAAIGKHIQERQRTSGLTYLHRDANGKEYWMRLGKVVDGPLESEKAVADAPERGFDLTTQWVDPIVAEVHRIRAKLASGQKLEGAVS